jgi:hypothetical protein
MDSTLQVFSAVATHLISFTTYDSFGHSKSRHIETFDDLAEELNSVGILTSRRTDWTANSLECFLSRCRKKYTLDELKSCCPYDCIGSEERELLSCDPISKRHPKPIRLKRTLYKNTSPQ